MKRWTLPKLYMLVAIRHAETRPELGNGAPVKLQRHQVAIARALARENLVNLGRAKAPDHGTTVALRDRGRAFVDDLLEHLKLGGVVLREVDGA